MKNLKRFLALLLSVLFIASSFAVAYAATTVTDESEPNNSYTSANTITDPVKGAAGTLESASDVDNYLFTVDEPGFVKVNFQHEAKGDDSIYFKVTLYTMSAENKENKIADFSVKGNAAKVSSLDVKLEGKQNYYIRVQAGASCADFKYTVSIESVSTKYAVESEPNNRVSIATPLTVNMTDKVGTNLCYGTITEKVAGYQKDTKEVDIYTFDAPKGYISFTMFNGKKVSGSDNGNYIFRLYQYSKETSPKPLLITSVTLSADKDVDYGPEIGTDADSYILQVEGADNATGSYGIEIYGKKDDASESEYNNSYSYADEIKNGSKLYASTSSKDDKDVFTVKTTSSESSKIILSSASSTPKGSWCASIQTSKGEEKATFNFGKESKEYSFADLAAGKYYIVITPTGEYTTELYTIKAEKVTPSSQSQTSSEDGFFAGIRKAIHEMGWKEWWSNNFSFMKEIDWMTTIKSLFHTLKPFVTIFKDFINTPSDPQ